MKDASQPTMDVISWATCGDCDLTVNCIVTPSTESASFALTYTSTPPLNTPKQTTDTFNTTDNNKNKMDFGDGTYISDEESYTTMKKKEDIL
jgi:hypothetical protein